MTTAPRFIMHKDISTRRVGKAINTEPKLLSSKIITHDNQQLRILLCKTYVLYDVLVGCLNTNHLKKFKKANNLNSILIKDSVFKIPLLVYDTFEELKDAKYTYDKIKEMIK